VKILVENAGFQGTIAEAANYYIINVSATLFITHVTAVALKYY
jgi:hypothetical protein